MPVKKRSGPGAERYVEATIELIVERGTSLEVTLREVSRRVGFAHTNAYNYFADLQDLLWHAIRQVLRIYGNAVTAGLDDTLSPRAFLRRMFRNTVEWAVENPGLHRFFSSDPMDPTRIPDDIVQAVVSMKDWYRSVLETLACGRINNDRLTRLVDVMLSYLDGEVFNLINGRVLPGEDIAGRIVDNLEHLFGILTASQQSGLELSDDSKGPEVMTYPKLEV